uniref:RNA binding motif protein 7 n=1 Tax=Zonotrichia albicollis TaxID=44394 RepID=A0A8D2N0W6_ZONAL
MCSWGWNALAERPAAARAPLQSSAPLGRGETEVWDESHRDMQIPKDRDGRPKQFAFVNFKHEESVPYGLRLLNGIKLYGRPMRIQFRSGSSHAAQDINPSCSQLGAPGTSLPGMPHPASNCSRYECTSPGSEHPRPSPLSVFPLQMNSAARQQPQFGGKYGEQPGFAPPGYPHSFHGLPGSPGPRRLEGPRKARLGRDEHRDGWSYEHRRDSYREAKWHSSRH